MTDLLRVRYIGPSMNPTLKAGDVLCAVPYEGRQVSRGDVLVFHARGGKGYVVHRAVDSDSSGIRTRGDNNPTIDPETLTPDRILGRVVSVERGSERIPIDGGMKGSLYARFGWAVQRIDWTVSRALHPIYRFLARRGVFSKPLSAWIRPRVLCFNKPQGIEMQLLMGRRVIGRRLAGQDHWRIRRPFRLLVDEASLPEDGGGSLEAS